MTGLRSGESQSVPRTVQSQAWALGRSTLASVETTASGHELVWHYSGRNATPKASEIPVKSGIPEHRGITLHGAWRGREKTLTHIEVRVRHWTPDILFAWRTDGPWNARRLSPVAAGDRGLIPAFGGDQAFSPLPLWFSPTVVQALITSGSAKVGKITLNRKGWTYHKMVTNLGQTSREKYVSIPVVVVARADTDDVYWVAPNGPNPLLLRAEKGGGIFYFAGWSQGDSHGESSEIDGVSSPAVGTRDQ